jgi:glycosyltransferase involved in cell wall biosynthesis
MKNLPKVSAYCCTYGRPFCLEEAIYSFLKQDYQGEKELVILNDLGDQCLFFDHPEVKIINSKKRIVPLNKKFNECISYCTGDYIFVWEDDDIYLPWKISYSIKNIDKNGCFHTGSAFLERQKNDLALCGNLHHSSLCMHIDNWEKIGFYDYDATDWCGVDQNIFLKIGKTFGNISKTLNPEDVFYIYRWGTSNAYHGSGTQTNISEFAKQNVDKYFSSGRISRGNVFLEPKWNYDFLEARNRCVSNLRGA